MARISAIYGTAEYGKSYYGTMVFTKDANATIKATQSLTKEGTAQIASFFAHKLRRDFAYMLDQHRGDPIYLIKDTQTLPINAIIQGITEKQRNIERFGNLESGEFVGYFKHMYEHLGSRYKVQTDDIIEMDGQKYRVVEIIKNFRLGEKIIYKEARLRRT